MSFYTALAILALSLTAEASRVKVSKKLKPTSDPPGSTCTVNTCLFLDEDNDCDCKQFGNAELVDRASNLLYDMVQNMRYLTDYHTTASFLSKLWNNAKITGLFTASFDDLEFLMDATQHVPEVEAIANTAVNGLAASDFQLPAGAMPIMVEIWDSNYLSGEFIGEVGVPFVAGQQSYNLPLQPNPTRSMRTFEMAGAGKHLGNVSFTTDFKMDEAPPQPCEHDSSRSCAKAVLTVSCNSASDLVDVDGYTQGVTDPYCKVRVKQDERYPSAKDKTPTIDEELNPTWTEENTFSYTWDVELAPPQVFEGDSENVDISAYVPWTLDQMTLMEQFISNTRFLIKHTALEGKECSEVAEKSAHQQKVCKFLASLDDFKVTEELVDEIAEDIPDSDIAEVLERVPITEEAGDSLLQKEEEMLQHLRVRMRPHRPRRIVHRHHYQPRPHVLHVHHSPRQAYRHAHFAHHDARRNMRRTHRYRRWTVVTWVLLFILFLPVGL